MHCLRRWMCVLVVVVSANVFAQQITGNIRGTVSDASGAVVQAATVTAKQVETGLTRTTTTDGGGTYVLVELPVGHYSLEVTARGFQKYLQQGISLDVNETATVSVRLAVGTETERVQVMADAQLIQSTSSSLGMVVNERELLDLPLDGRNFSQLGLLQTGVVPLTAGLKEAGGSLRDGQAYAVDGQRPESNNFLIDGANNVNSVDAGFVLRPPIDAISEFRILAHNANAEFGQNSGSTTNIITRSGTNSFHGAAWEFLRNDAMDEPTFDALGAGSQAEPVWRDVWRADRKKPQLLFCLLRGLPEPTGRDRGCNRAFAAAADGKFFGRCVRGAWDLIRTGCATTSAQIRSISSTSFVFATTAASGASAL